MAHVDSAIDIEYPEADGRPMGETDIHRSWMIRIHDMLAWRYREQPVYVGSDLLVYFAQGQPYKFVVPDVFVVKDCGPHQRRTFKIWEEGKTPNVVFEVTSRSTRQEDEGRKALTYADIGVKELFLYDPTGEYLAPPLCGFRLAGLYFEPMEPDASGALVCEELNLLLHLDGRRLVLSDRASGEILLTEAQAERAAKEAERAAREAAEAKAAALEEELRKLRRQIDQHKSNGP